MRFRSWTSFNRTSSGISEVESADELPNLKNDEFVRGRCLRAGPSLALSHSYPLPVEFSSNHVDGAKSWHDVSHHETFQHLVHARHQRKAGRSDANSVGTVWSVADNITPQLTVGTFNAGVGLAFRWPYPMSVHDEHEMVHQALDIAVGVAFGRQDSAFLGCHDLLIHGIFQAF